MVLAYGIGVDSTALLIEKHARGEALQHLRTGGEAEHIAGYRHDGAGGQVLGQPVDVFGRVGDAQAHQLDRLARQLALGLLEVARIGPQAGKVWGDHQGADRTVEAAQPLAPLPALGQVFGQVRVGGGYDHGSEPQRLQALAQGG